MTKNIEKAIKSQLKTGLPDVRPGDTVRVHQKIKETSKKGKQEEKKERIQVFEGQVIAKKHGQGVTSTITVRRTVSNFGVEKIFPLHSPTIDKIEIIKKAKARRAKLYYLREAKGKKAKLKREKAVT